MPYLSLTLNAYRTAMTGISLGMTVEVKPSQVVAVAKPTPVTLYADCNDSIAAAARGADMFALANLATRLNLGGGMYVTQQLGSNVQAIRYYNTADYIRYMLEPLRDVSKRVYLMSPERERIDNLSYSIHQVAKIAEQSGMQPWLMMGDRLTVSPLYTI